jgi:hypothetical protein
MLIAIQNDAPDLLNDNAKLLSVVRAISRQIYYDFEPYWNLSAKLRLAVTKKRISEQLDPVSADAAISLLKWQDRPRELEQCEYMYGYHDFKEGTSHPEGYVFVTDLQSRKRSDWTVTLSHEVLELIANPHCNLWVI